MTTILITGAAGSIGTMLRSRLARAGRVLRLLDVAPLPGGPGPGEESVTASVTDMAAMTAACKGADAIIHLGGIPSEAAWAPVLDVNINGTYTVFEAARRAGVPRVVFASSNHAVGFAPRESFPVPDAAYPVPDTYYGVSKAAGEALAALYATPLWPRCHLRPHPVLLRAAAEPADAVHLAVARRRPGPSRPASPRPRPASASSTACRTTPAAAGCHSTAPGLSATSRETTPSTTPPTSSPPPATGPTPPTRFSATWGATSPCRPATPPSRPPLTANPKAG